ncbi:MAG: hypothetical protein ABIT20_13025 [Gemmatimonadaceae bacterium]
MRDWTLVVCEGYPHKSKTIFTTDDPKAGKWHKVAAVAEYADPAFFLDDDGRLYLYLYFGSSLNGGISVVELDPRDNFKVVSGPTKLMEGFASARTSKGRV